MTERKYKNYKSFNSSYIGGWTFEDGDKTFTIKDVQPMMVRNEKNQSGEEKMCIIFEEIDKPMVLNSTNNETITKVIGSGLFDDWIGQRITIGTERIRAFGDVWDAVRVRPEKPTPAGEPLSETQKTRIRELIDSGQVKESAMLKYYKVASVERLTRDQARALIIAKTGEEVE